MNHYSQKTTAQNAPAKFGKKPENEPAQKDVTKAPRATVCILVTIPDERSFDACTLCFETLRTGWPTARIIVYDNANAPDIAERLYDKLSATVPDALFQRYEKRIHLGNWIAGHINQGDGPRVICDPDTIFWKSCEDWTFPQETLLAGYYVPRMWNDFAKCVSVPRIHTSMMVFPNLPMLRTAIVAAYPWAHKPHGEYCPCDPFIGRVMFDNGVPTFWDCAANLYQILTSERSVPGWVQHFKPEHLECFDHLNSASFYDVMMERMDDNRGFALAHNEWIKRPELLRNLWPLVQRYYNQKAREAEISKP